ncbi:MAG: hypothetical protein ABW137_06540 [Mycobacterium sp.]
MKKVLVLGVGAIGSAAMALGMGSGVATADDAVVGQTYADAKAALSEQGMAAVVATSIGGRKNLDECLVTSASAAPSIDGFGGQRAGTMLVNLNCSAK